MIIVSELYLNEPTLGLGSPIIFHGYVEDISQVLKNCHAVLLPSIAEGLPLVIVEAMLCGRVCIATNVGGVSELIENNKTGFIIPAAHAESVDETLEIA